jgi:hypothetical protein
MGEGEGEGEENWFLIGSCLALNQTKDFTMRFKA